MWQGGENAQRHRDKQQADWYCQRTQAQDVLACCTKGATDYEAGDRHPGVSGALTRLGYAACNISPRSMVKTVTLVVITAVEGAPVSEIRTSAF